MFATITRTALILDSERQRPTPGFVPWLQVACFLRSDSAVFIIVTIGLPDPKCAVLNPHVETLSLIYAGPPHKLLPQRIWASAECSRLNFRGRVQAFATRNRVILVADEILARRTSRKACAVAAMLYGELG